MKRIITIPEERESILGVEGKLHDFEKQFKYLKSSNTWQPFRYGICVEQMEQIIEYLNRIAVEFSDTSNREGKEIRDYTNGLLKQYKDLWDNEYN